MSSRDKKKAALYHKLRSATNSTSVNQASIVVDASRYIEELKERVEALNQDVASLQNSSQQDSLPAQVKVETLEKGFLINVLSEKNCPGLLVSILEAFEEIGLEVLDARVSCSDNFRLEAVSENEGQSDSIDAQVIKQAVLQAIRSWSDQQED
ncbi:transcription factor SCREAM-like protein [Perilla frutescens var. hirtella]|uniref:Transcription factor SCREAM-like protein n=1 Tax=Perilla frutescens var. hirtella TaxID=608512 RepID=A0AAD4NYJ9_PERFH|nr:transcription factor SCREAM-like protein [Perilla frutescens var. hirtella]KAH6777951.1 transcription factor SCREAM-like protein [Perilla frutescens var. frutescens]KAH6786992.1 transcription factor SCREAM-like protein [Perilla frutescens var. hirtella]